MSKNKKRRNILKKEKQEKVKNKNLFLTFWSWFIALKLSEKFAFISVIAALLFIPTTINSCRNGIERKDIEEIRENGKKNQLEIMEHLSALEKRIPLSENDVKEKLDKGQEEFNLNKPKIEEALREFIKADGAYKNNDYKEAILHFKQLIKQAPLPSFYVVLADNYFQISEYNLAMENYNMAIEVAKGKEEYPIIQLYALKGMAEVSIQTGDFQGAVKNLLLILPLSKEVTDKEIQIQVLGLIGDSYDSLADYNKANEYYNRALELSQHSDEEHSEGILLGNLGIIERHKENYSLAKTYYERSLAIVKRYGDKKNEEIMLGMLGEVYKNLGNPNEAIKYLNEALELARNLGHLIGEEKWLSNLGSVYRVLKNYPKAVELLEQSLEIARKIGDKQGEAAKLGNLGHVYLQSGDYNKAIKFTSEAIAICKAVGDKANQFVFLKNLGIAYARLNQDSFALANFKQAIEVAKSISPNNLVAIKEVEEWIIQIEKGHAINY